MKRGRSLTALVLVLGLGLAVAVTGTIAGARADEARLWAQVRSGEAFVILRHALAPGYGDPDGFRVDDCATQRNLSDEGRAQARRIGRRFRDNGIATARVLTSQWCRCRETAELLDLGPVSELEPLNSFFENREAGPVQTAQLEDWLREQPPGGTPIVLVTHQVNITALTGIVPQSGGMVVARLERWGRIAVLGEL